MLQSIAISTSVASIGDSAISGCRNLRSISIPHIFGFLSPKIFPDIPLSEIVIQSCIIDRNTT